MNNITTIIHICTIYPHMRYAQMCFHSCYDSYIYQCDDICYMFKLKMMPCENLISGISQYWSISCEDSFPNWRCHICYTSINDMRTKLVFFILGETIVYWVKVSRNRMTLRFWYVAVDLLLRRFCLLWCVYRCSSSTHMNQWDSRSLSIVEGVASHG